MQPANTVFNSAVADLAWRAGPVLEGNDLVLSLDSLPQLFDEFVRTCARHNTTVERHLGTLLATFAHSKPALLCSMLAYMCIASRSTLYL